MRPPIRLTAIPTLALTLAMLAPAPAALAVDGPTVHVGTAVTTTTATDEPTEPAPDVDVDVEAGPGAAPDTLTDRWVSLAGATAAAYTRSGSVELQRAFATRADSLFNTDTGQVDLASLGLAELTQMDTRTAGVQQLMAGGTASIADITAAYTQSPSIDTAAVAAGIDWAQSRSALTAPTLQLPDPGAAAARMAQATPDTVGFGLMLRETMTTFAQSSPTTYAQVSSGLLGRDSFASDWSQAVTAAGGRIGDDLADRMPAPDLAAFTLAMATGDPGRVTDRFGTDGYDTDCVAAGLFMHADLLRLGGNDVQRTPGSNDLTNPAGQILALPNQQQWAEQLGVAGAVTADDVAAQDTAGQQSLNSCVGATAVPGAVEQMMDSAFGALSR